MARLRRTEEPFDPHELGARRSDPTLGAFEPLPPNPRRTTNTQLLMLFVAVIAGIALLREGVGGRPPEVSGSCTSPAFALSAREVKAFDPLKWSAAGPADAHVVIGIDTTAVPATLEDGKLAGPIALAECEASGLFAVRTTEGDHVIRAYLVRADGSSTLISEHKVSVLAP